MCRMIGESTEIGGAAASDSYLRIDAVIEAAQRCGAEAIHPGFGFLAENAAFARAVERAGLVFIGPTAETIERLGDKASAKREAEAADVPTVPGSRTASEDAAEIAGIVARSRASGDAEGRGRRRRQGHACRGPAGRSWPAKSNPRCARRKAPSAIPG